MTPITSHGHGRPAAPKDLETKRKADRAMVLRWLGAFAPTQGERFEELPAPAA